jgi:hypothetical protein
LETGALDMQYVPTAYRNAFRYQAYIYRLTSVSIYSPYAVNI